MWGLSPPIIYSDIRLVLFDAASPGTCRLQSADARILLPLYMAPCNAPAACGREMASDSNFAGARSAERRRGLGTRRRGSRPRRTWQTVALAGPRTRHARHRPRPNRIWKDHP